MILSLTLACPSSLALFSTPVPFIAFMPVQHLQHQPQPSNPCILRYQSNVHHWKEIKKEIVKRAYYFRQHLTSLKQEHYAERRAQLIKRMVCTARDMKAEYCVWRDISSSMREACTQGAHIWIVVSAVQWDLGRRNTLWTLTPWGEICSAYLHFRAISWEGVKIPA